MKRCFLVAILSALLPLTSANSVKHEGLETPSERLGFIVSIGADGKALAALNWNGSEVEYATDEKFRIGTDPTFVAFFSQTGPESFLANVNGEWVLRPWQERPKQVASAERQNDTTSAIALAIVGPEGEMLRLIKSDGTALQVGRKLLEAALVTSGSHTCWKKCGNHSCCRCEHCPWGCRHS